MQKRQINGFTTEIGKTLENKWGLENGRQLLILNALCRDYTSVFFYDLNTDQFEILKRDEKSNSIRLFGSRIHEKLEYSEELKNYCTAYVIDKDQKNFLNALDRNMIRKRLEKSERFFYRYECVPDQADHKYYEVQVVRINEKKLDGTVLLAFHYIDDIVEEERQRQKELKSLIENEERTKRLEKEKESAIAANEMKSRFLSSISHDLRTPINGLQGMLRIADAYPNDMKKQNECREKMWIASNYLVSLVNNVLNMNRLENKEMDLTEQPFNLIDLLMNITTLTDLQINAQGLHSVKYNKKDGTVYCRCMEKEFDGETAWFEFITSDTGIGMDKEFLKHAFEPYVQENNKTLNSMNGVGLGLSIVKQTVEAMHGTIQVESKVNEGTKYTIMLPFKIDPNPQKKKTEVKYISLKGKRALLVEDNDLNLEITKFHLEQEKMLVDCAVNGAEAVEKFTASKIGYYDIILMDIMMPIMNGLDATKTIREMNRADALAIPIIAMSANAFEKDIEESLAAGMNEYLTKPVDGKKITDTLKKYLANKEK